MNYFKIGFIYIIALLSQQDKQFVDFKLDQVKITQHQERLTVILPFEILETYHVQSEKVEDNNFIPTEIHFDTLNGFKILGYKFSKVNRENLVLDKLECEVLSGRLEVTVQIEAISAKYKSLHLKGHLYYQACDDRQCFYPRTLQFVVKQPIN